MKTRLLFLFCYLLPLLLLAQDRKKFEEEPRWYVGIEALLRGETVHISANFAPVTSVPEEADVGPGFVIGYRPTRWLTLETGAYRLRYIHRLRLISDDLLLHSSLWRGDRKFREMEPCIEPLVL